MRKNYKYKYGFETDTELEESQLQSISDKYSCGISFGEKSDNDGTWIHYLTKDRELTKKELSNLIENHGFNQFFFRRTSENTQKPVPGMFKK
jgi:hypothetical protein|tara:strand:+ start:465 stop:740 length:276 start_codon:yes stop_codon:yes gene_type:complete